MKNINPLLFIDANQYLDLYNPETGTPQLPALQEQSAHIFVTTMIVDEVQRRKVGAAADFLKQKPKKEKELAHVLLAQITRSEDEVSKTLAALFAHAIPPTEDALQRARRRKELGNAPGKKTGPLGDQLNWEQILEQCQEKSAIWIITRDPDYATTYEGKMFLNAMLYRDLVGKYPRPPEVFCFNNILEGIDHFAKLTMTKADKLPSPEKIEEIKKELDLLPPRGWQDTSMDDANMVAILSRRQLSPALWATFYSQGDEGWHPGMKPDSDKTDQ
jgi:hypothetical protein